MTLFDPGPGAPPPTSESYGSRLTAKNAGIIASGRNPATLLRIIDNGRTCADCSHLRCNGGYARTFYKCELHRQGMTFGPATDVRKSWPACESFEAGE